MSAIRKKTAQDEGVQNTRIMCAENLKGRWQKKQTEKSTEQFITCQDNEETEGPLKNFIVVRSKMFKFLSKISVIVPKLKTNSTKKQHYANTQEILLVTPIECLSTYLKDMNYIVNIVMYFEALGTSKAHFCCRLKKVWNNTRHCQGMWHTHYRNHFKN